MSVYHIRVEMSDGWYCVSALEDSGIYTQGRTLDEAVVNIREVIALIRNDKRPQLEIILPAEVQLVRHEKNSRTRRRRMAG